MGGGVDVFEGSVPLLVLDVDVLVPADGVEVEVLAEELVAAVSGGVVDDDDEVVGVVLQEDGVQVVLQPELGVVVVAGHHHAHRDLLAVLVQLVDAAHPVVLLLVHALLLLQVAVVVLHVVLHQPQTLEVGLLLQELDPLQLELDPLLPRLLVPVDHLVDAGLEGGTSFCRCFASAASARKLCRWELPPFLPSGFASGRCP
jgi:hypothetical protein